MSQKITAYEAKRPLILQQVIAGKSHTFSIPEGGNIGFNLDQVFMRNSDSHWQVCLTTKAQFLVWLDNGDIKPRKLEKLPHEGTGSETLKKKIEAHKRKEVKIELPVHGDSI